MTRKNFFSLCLAALLFLMGCSQNQAVSSSSRSSSSSNPAPSSSDDFSTKASFDEISSRSSSQNETSENRLVPADDHSSSQDQAAANQNVSLEVISNPVPAVTQENAYYCGPAVLQSLLAYHGITASQEELANELKTHPVTGTEYEDLARVASIRIFGQEPADDQASGYRAEMYKTRPFTDEEADLFLSRLAADLCNGDPVFIGLNCATTRPQDGVDAVHLVLAYGMQRDPQTQEIVSVEVMDPSYLAQKDGTAYFTIPTATLVQAIRDCKEGAYVW